MYLRVSKKRALGGSWLLYMCVLLVSFYMANYDIVFLTPCYIFPGWNDPWPGQFVFVQCSLHIIATPSPERMGVHCQKKSLIRISRSMIVVVLTGD